MKYGEIYLVDFDKAIGHEYKGKRPALIIQSDQQLKKSNLITIMPLTSQTGNCHIDDVLIKKDTKNRLFSHSVIKFHHIMSFDKSRFVKKIGEANDKVLEKVKNYLKVHFDIN